MVNYKKIVKSQNRYLYAKRKLLDNWSKELSKITKETKIEFEIKALEEFLK
ncbi:hypothetical protein CAPN004_23400 [Capnocytophaga cynodegmi]|nr:hypothetical protein CAPN004_23400 [Capnocytophaga cynodegmi]